MAGLTSALPALRRVRSADLRARATTTPGRLRALGLLLLVGAILAAVVMASAVASRRSAARAAALQTGPLMVEADGLYASLSDADATAARTFLAGSQATAALRQRYVSHLELASAQLSELGRDVTSPVQARTAVTALATDLPQYSGLIEAARANNVQGFPVGAAYLRQASRLMRDQMLPAAGQLYALEARRLGADYRSGTSTGDLLALVAVAAALLGLLAVTQVFLARRTHRILNVALLVATGVLVAVTAWAVAGVVAEQSSLSRAQHQGSDSVQVLSAGRILALRAAGDESLALVARGGSPEDLTDFDKATAAIAPPGGLLGEARSLARRSGSTAAIDQLDATFAQYLALHGRIATLEQGGLFDGADRLAVGPTAPEATLFDSLNNGLGTQIDTAQRRFSRSATDATSALDGLWLAIPLLVSAAAVLVLFGLQQRIGEYR